MPDTVSVDAETAAIVGDDTSSEFDVVLSGCMAFIRMQAAVTITGGASPALPISSTIALGGFTDLPR